MWADATVTVNPSGNWADPASWPVLVREIGVGGFFLLFFAALFALFFWRFGGLVFGANGWVERFYKRTDDFLTTQEKISAINSDTLREQMELCKHVHAVGGAGNVQGLKNAGHAFAEMGRKIGEKVKADVETEASDIHKALRSHPQE